MVARFLQWPPEDLQDDNSLYATLYFGDGSQKMLAAMTCWIALLLCWRHHGSEGLQDKFVQAMLTSFLSIPSIVKATDARSNQLESAINRIVAQNMAARVQPISSFAWSSILRTACASDRVQQTTFEEALQSYNSHPQVLAYERSSTGTGAGSISLDSRKRQGVRNWLERTSSESYEEVLRSCHDYPFNLGPFGESFSYTNQCFLRSTSGLEALPASDGFAPMEGESFVEAVGFCFHLSFFILFWFQIKSIHDMFLMLG